MPALLEVQRVFAYALAGRDVARACRLIARDGIAPERRFAVHEQTFASTLGNALAVAFPAVRRLLGEECFAGVAWHYAHREPPRSAWLDEYGATFGNFLGECARLRDLAYVADVARLEYAVNRALHAPDTVPLDTRALARVPRARRASIVFVAHPAVSALACRFPADAIWRAVLAGDEQALRALDVRADPAVLLVERRDGVVDVARIPLAHARLTVDLLGGECLADALASHAGDDAAEVLAEHVAYGRFAGFRVARGTKASHGA